MTQLYAPTLFDTLAESNAKRPSKPVADTKRASYTKTQETAGSKRKQVLDCLHKHGPLTMHQIEDLTHLLRSSVCGRVSELRKAGLIYELEGSVYDPDTERPVKRYGVVMQANSNA